MICIETGIAGVCIVESESVLDHRGAFSRIFCSDELRPVFGNRQLVQINHTRTSRVGTIRGLHFQFGPQSEMKMVRCLKGRVWDVAVDLRRGSTTFLKWFGAELTPELNRALVVPEGCAHGFQVLQSESELLYIHTAMYSKSHEGGVRFDDPSINISWPLPVAELSVRDANLPLIAPDFEGLPS